MGIGLLQRLKAHSRENFKIFKAKCSKFFVIVIYLLTCKVEILDWPARSPDINPMENIWAILKKQVSKRNPETIEELEHATHLECQDFSPQIVYTLFCSIHNRIKLLIEGEGVALSY